ncbi:MAG: hypothetical protein Q9201_002855 [Fulgogasparrea decipioides]
MAKNRSHESKSTSIVIGSCFAIVIVTIVISARLGIRWSRLRTLGIDDFVVIPACLSCVAYLSLIIASATAGCVGRHIYTCTYKELADNFELSRIDFPLFYLTVFLVKISITLQNRRITGISSNKWQIAHWIYLTLLIILLPICVSLNAFTCVPVATWYSLQAIAKVNRPMKDIKCLDKDAISIATRNLHIITDWLLIPVPLIIIWRTKMKLQKKLRLMSVFAVGLVSSVASIARNILIAKPTLDQTYDYYAICAWDIVDVLTACMVASLPALNGFVDASATRVRNWGSEASSFLRGKIIALGGSTNESLQSDKLENSGEWNGRSNRDKYKGTQVFIVEGWSL